MTINSNKLSRSLDLKDAVAIGLGAVIGAGIFVVTGVAAGIAGPAFIVSLIIAGIVASFNALSSAQLAAVYPQAGGTYEYGYRLLHPLLGFSAGWMFLISKLAAAGVVAIGFGSYLFQLLPLTSAGFYSITAIILLVIANYFGIKKAGAINLIIISITILSLLYFIINGAPQIQKENFAPFSPFGLNGIAEASALLFFAFTGYARIATLAEEVHNPEETIPRAIIITIITAIILYVAVSIVAVGVIGTEAMASTTSPLQRVGENISAPGIEFIIVMGASTAMLGVLLSQVLGISRMMLAMSRRQDLPAFLKVIHQQYNVPHSGILLTGSIVVILVLVGSFQFILNAAAFSILLYYTITNLAALKQPQHEKLVHSIIPALGLIGCIAMAFSLPIKVIISGFAILLLGILLRFLIKWINQ
ncbi:MAG: amino acid permease [Bacteroidota bacterium]|nr:amino acid permease [Bacteroidota bacterium]